jgi:Na+-driven multidrug efflux pump
LKTEPTPTPTPSQVPQQKIEFEAILGVAIVVAIVIAVLSAGLGLLIYLIKRKSSFVHFRFLAQPVRAMVFREIFKLRN